MRHPFLSIYLLFFVFTSCLLSCTLFPWEKVVCFNRKEFSHLEANISSLETHLLTRAAKTLLTELPPAPESIPFTAQVPLLDLLIEVGACFYYFCLSIIICFASILFLSLFFSAMRLKSVSFPHFTWMRQMPSNHNTALSTTVYS